MKERLFYYWAAMNVSAVQSSAISAKAYIGAAVGSAATQGMIPALDLKQLAAVLGFSFVMSIIDWLSKNPIPISEPQKDS